MAMAMATTLISMHLLLLMMMIYTAAFHAAIVEADFRFSYAQADRTLPSNLVLQNNASLKSDGTVWLTPNPNEQLSSQMRLQEGWLLYNVSFPWETNTTSFSTSFEFQFITSLDGAGDGMAFFISPQNSVPDHSLGMMLGLLPNDTYNIIDPSRHLFALEFDTYRNTGLDDPNNNHAGIDINSLISTVTVNLNSSSLHPDLNLYQNSSFMVWVDYYAATTSIELRMLNINNMTHDTISRPLDPLLNLTHDLSTVFLDSPPLFVGISASTGASSQGCAIGLWNFTLSTPPHPSQSNSSNTTSNNPVPSPPQISKPVNNDIKPILIPSILSLTIVVAIATALLAYWKRWCCSTDDDQNMELALIPNDVLVPAAMPRYTYKQLWKATQGFHDKARVGRGGYSTVYKGRLLVTQKPGAKGESSMVYEEVAVKRLNKEGLRKSDEFFWEINMINKLQHPRLVELKGWCYEKGEAMLVYQFMSNGSLADHLFSRKQGRGVLSSESRVEILKGVAEALSHLHAAGAVHRDVKAANVLLTSDFVAMLGDFGLLRLLKDDNHMTQTMTAAGTPGYTAPEVIFTRTPTNKVDVYSYGVLALEVACGRRVIDLSSNITDERVLVEWVWSKHESGALMKALDPDMEIGALGGHGEVNNTIWRCILHIALKCCHPTPEARLEMQEVLHTLQHGVVVPLEPTRPPYPGGFIPHHPGLRDNEINSSTSTSTFTYSSNQVVRLS